MFRKLMMKIGVGYITGKIKDAAEGRLGKEWQDRYLFWKGKKTYIGLTLSLATAYAMDQGQTAMAATLALAAGVFLQTGMLDKAWNNTRPEWLTNSALYRFLANNAEYISAGLVAITGYLYSADCTAEWCATAKVYLPCAAFILAQLGLIDAPWKAPKPDVPGKR